MKKKRTAMHVVTSNKYSIFNYCVSSYNYIKGAYSGNKSITSRSLLLISRPLFAVHMYMHTCYHSCAI